MSKKKLQWDQINSFNRALSNGVGYFIIFMKIKIFNCDKFYNNEKKLPKNIEITNSGEKLSIEVSWLSYSYVVSYSATFIFTVIMFIMGLFSFDNILLSLIPLPITILVSIQLLKRTINKTYIEVNKSKISSRISPIKLMEPEPVSITVEGIKRFYYHTINGRNATYYELYAKYDKNSEKIAFFYNEDQLVYIKNLLDEFCNIES
ncbi:MAG: hypothetical protein GY714_12525 [Desulfobacterales bacterium]|nr:hypothetical protein [Desulfobacterales bacterium]